MKIVETPDEAYAHVDHWRREGQRIGLIPTMGALHDGHFSLVRRSLDECDITAATIFVNPTQFGPHEDFAKYPRTLDDDLTQLHNMGVDLVFTPQRERLYPEGFSTYVEPPTLANPLEGVCRPGHFRGVTTIVLKLFQILPATVAYFGQKDYQQLAVLKRMAEDLNIPVRVQGCPTLREQDGLAMSSRNRYLNEHQRQSALALWKSLSQVQDMVHSGVRHVELLEETLQTTLYQEGAERIDYARIVDAEWLTDLDTIEDRAVALIAAHVGSTRLIDNLVLETT